MEKVKAEVVMHYRSELVEHLRANGCTFAYGNTGIHLAKEFGFCYGVERAIDLAYAAAAFPRNSRSTFSERLFTTRMSTSRFATWGSDFSFRWPQGRGALMTSARVTR